jgi:hypothetical protein
MVEQPIGEFKFNFFAFIIAFAIGIFYVYISTPKPKIVIKYPTPYNCNKIVYRNDNDICYKYSVEEVKCTDKAIDQPLI